MCGALRWRVSPKETDGERAVIRVFVSFDYDTDRDLYGNLAGQIRRGDPAVPIAVESLPSVVHDRAWRHEARGLIRRADAVIFICGVNTHSARGVEAEMSITRDERKPYVLLRGRRDEPCSKPRNARQSDVMHSWKWRRIESLLRERLHAGTPVDRVHRSGACHDG